MFKKLILMSLLLGSLLLAACGDAAPAAEGAAAEPASTEPLVISAIPTKTRKYYSASSANWPRTCRNSWACRLSTNPSPIMRPR